MQPEACPPKQPFVKAVQMTDAGRQHKTADEPTKILTHWQELI